MKEHADKALQYFISVEPSKALSLLLVRCMNFQFLHISNPVIEIFPRTSHWDFFYGGNHCKSFDRCYHSSYTFVVCHFRHFLLLKTFYCLAALDCQLSDSVYKGLQVLLLDVKLHSHSIICISAGLISNSWINISAANADGFWWWTSPWLCYCLLSIAPITRLLILDQIFKRPITLDVLPMMASWCF